MCRAFRRRLFYPVIYFAALPLYAFLTFELHIPFALATIGVVAITTILMTTAEIAEGLFFRNRKTKPRLALDAYYIVMGVIVSTLLAYVYVVFGVWLRNRLALPAIGPLLPRPLEFLAALLLMDLCAYWIHRFQHRSEESIFWRSHSVHHALSILDVVAGAQVHVLDGVVSGSPLLLVALCGFSPEACAGAYAMNLVSAGLHHSDLVTDLQWFNYVTIAPQAHRWHHADATDKTVNFGFVLAIWDILFGTFWFRPERRPETYGARSIEVFPKSVAGHILVGTTAKAYHRLVKADLSG